GDPTGDRLVEQGLARVVDVRTRERGAVVTGTRAEVLLVHDKERCPVRTGQFVDADTADGEFTVDTSSRGGPHLRVEGVEVLGRERWVVLRQDFRVAGTGGVGVATHDGLSAGIMSVGLRRAPSPLSTRSVKTRGSGRSPRMYGGSSYSLVGADTPRRKSPVRNTPATAAGSSGSETVPSTRSGAPWGHVRHSS